MSLVGWGDKWWMMSGLCWVVYDDDEWVVYDKRCMMSGICWLVYDEWYFDRQLNVLSCTTANQYYQYELNAHAVRDDSAARDDSVSRDNSAPEMTSTYYIVRQTSLNRLLRVLKLYYTVARSQLPALQIAPRTKVVLESRQFSPSSSTDTPRTKVVPQSRQFSASSSTDCSAHYSCTR